MKKFTKTVSLLAASALLVLLPNSNALTASAEGPETYTILYDEDEGSWCYANSEDAEKDDYDDDMDDFYEKVKDGDHVGIIGDSDGNETFKIPAYLGSLTVIDCDDSAIIVYTNGINEYHAGVGALTSVSGDIQTAYVYDDAQVTIHSNVNTLKIETDNDADVVCKGTVAHAICINDDEVEFDIYNVAANKLRVDDGELDTDDEYYSETPTSVPAAPAATPAPQAPAASNDYDDVPKTGEANTIYLLLAAAALCFAGSRALKRA